VARCSTSAINESPARSPAWASGRGDKIAILARKRRSSISNLQSAGLRAGACGGAGCRPWRAGRFAREDARSIATPRLFPCPISTQSWSNPDRRPVAKLIAGGRIAYDFKREGWRDFRDVAGAGERCPVRGIPGQQDDFTSSTAPTTGLPKGILHSHVMRDLLAVRVHSVRLRPDTISLASTANRSTRTRRLVALLATVVVGGTTILDARSPHVRLNSLEIAHRERVTHAMLVPVQYQRILAHPTRQVRLEFLQGEALDQRAVARPIKADCLKRWPGR